MFTDLVNTPQPRAYRGVLRQRLAWSHMPEFVRQNAPPVRRLSVPVLQACGLVDSATCKLTAFTSGARSTRMNSETSGWQVTTIAGRLAEMR